MNEIKNHENNEVSPLADSCHSSNKSESNLSNCSQSSSDKESKKYIKLKLLVPSYAAGAIIGKNGETISQIQQKTEARVKLSKPQEIYPGTSDRVCLISGLKKSVLEIYDFISQKIQEVPDSKTDDRSPYPRHKQVKILVASSTAGMIIGKGGKIIKDIKKSTNAFIQLSQKPPFSDIPERCVIVAGEPDKTRKIVEIIIDKIIEDPNSSVYADIVYDDPFTAPSPYPTGSPFASTHSPGNHIGPAGLPSHFATLAAISSTGHGSQHHPHSNHANSSTVQQGTASSSLNQLLNQNRFYPHASLNSAAGNPRITGAVNQRFLNSNSHFNYKLPHRSLLRSAGYPEFVIDDILSALHILDIHGVNLKNLGGEHNLNRNTLPRIGVSGSANPNNLGHHPNYYVSNSKSTPNEPTIQVGSHNRNYEGI